MAPLFLWTSRVHRTVAELRLRREALSWRAVEGEVVALDAQGSNYFATNAAGSLLWEALAAGTTRDALVAGLIDAYSIERGRAEADVDKFLEALAANGLLET
jgi:hypothetical protein